MFDVKRRKTPQKYADVNAYLEESVVLSSRKCKKEIFLTTSGVERIQTHVSAHICQQTVVSYDDAALRRQAC